VAFTYNTMLKPDAGSNTAYKLATLVGADAVAADQSLDAEGIEVIDDRTISFTFTEPNAGLLSTTFGNSFIAPRHVFDGLALADYATKFQTDFIGSGPYKVLEYQYDQGATLEANPDYRNGTGYAGPPNAERVAIRMFADANAQLLAAEAGELDFTYYRQPSGDTLARFAGIAGMHVVPSPVGFNVFYSIPYKDRPWANKEFRQALAYATDRETMAEINGGSAASAVINDWTAAWAVADDLNPYTYDLDKAREMLAASGFDTSQVLDVRIYPYAATPDEIPVLLDTWRNELGLQITERPFTSDGFVKEFYEDFDYDIGFVYGFGTLDGQPYGSNVTNACASTYPTGFNGVAYCNEEWDAAFAAGLAAPTPEEQATNFQRASQIWNDDLPFFPYFNRIDAAIVSDQLTGIDNMQMFHPSGGGGRYWEWGVSG
jgi:peptide/nickel transport system substrate-binding protein